MHEFELGVWKAIFTHLLRILYAQGGDGIQILNKRFFIHFYSLLFMVKPLRRYREVPTFGRDTIRKFVHNASGMKKLAARDFEDLLQVCFFVYGLVSHTYHFQCSIPVFDGLFDSTGSNNTIILDLLFELSTWHGLAKLRLHTESTVRSLENSTTRLGIALRKFQSTTCAEFVTHDLPSEEAARGRRKAAKAKLKPTTQNLKSKGKQKATDTDSRFRSFNLSNYKTHALADYPKTIRELGTTDSYSTQNVSYLF